MIDYIKGQRVKIEFELNVPEDCTSEELQKWLEFELGANGSIDGNILDKFHCAVQAISFPGIEISR